MSAQRDRVQIVLFHPRRPIIIILTVAAGGVTDVGARALG